MFKKMKKGSQKLQRFKRGTKVQKGSKSSKRFKRVTKVQEGSRNFDDIHDKSCSFFSPIII